MTEREYNWLLALTFRKHPDDSDPTDDQLLAMRRAIIEDCALEVESAGGDSYDFHARRIRALGGELT